MKDEMQTADSTTPRSSVLENWAPVFVAIMLMIHVVLGVMSISRKSMVYDEIAHLTAGYSYWSKNDYRLHPENGNLPQRWLAFPAWIQGFNFPDDAQAWSKSNVWEVGDEFLFRSDNPFKELLQSGRLAALVLSTALCVVVYRWSREIFGVLGGLMSLLSVCLSPTILAHGRLATSDVCLTLFLTLSVWFIWRCLNHLTGYNLAGCALAIPAALLSKFSAVVILPLAVLMIVLRLVSRRPMRIDLGGKRQFVLQRSRQQLLAMIVPVLVCGLSSWCVIWAAYGFRYSASNESAWQGFDRFKTVNEMLGEIDGLPATMISSFERWRVLPEAYLHGTAYVLAHRERNAFFNGERSREGWWQFFPFAVAVKTPFATLVLLLLAVVALPRLFKPSVGGAEDKPNPPIAVWCDKYFDLIPLAAQWCVLWSMLISSSLNIGHRHALMVYPAIFVAIGANAHWIKSSWRGATGGRRRPLMGIVILVALGWSAGEVWRVHPDYLAYFNQAVPRERAYEYLVDSNLDWGQDLPQLAEYLETVTPTTAVYLAYFGKDRPEMYGINAQVIPIRDVREPFARVAHGGIYCVSATHLQTVYSVFPEWSASEERQYRDLSKRLEQIVTSEGEGALRRRIAAGDQMTNQMVMIHEMGAAARLMAYLRERKPDVQIGFSILIFHLRDAEVQQALRGELFSFSPLPR